MTHAVDSLEFDDAYELAPEQLVSFDRAARLHAVLVRLSEPPDETGGGALRAREIATQVAAALSAQAWGLALQIGDGLAARFSFTRINDEGAEVSSSEHEISLVEDESSAGCALAATEPIVFESLSREMRFSDATLRALGIVAGVVCPLAHAGRFLGTLGIYATGRREFPPDEQLFVDSVARLLAGSLAYEQVERMLAEQTRLLHTAMDSLESPLIELTPEGRIVRFNRACQRTTGFSSSEVRDRHLWSALFLPEDLPAAHEAFERLRKGESPVRLETFILTKHGERRRIAWSFSVIPDIGEESPGKLVGSGIDVTELHVARQMLHQTQAEMSDAKRSLLELHHGDERLAAFVERRICHLAGPLKADRREYPRRAFPYKQLVGPLRSGRSPRREDLHEVQCRDISQRGFSYLEKTPPDYRELIVAFGAPPAQTLLMARVMHVQKVLIDNEEMTLVGCEYVCRSGPLS